MRDSSDWVGQLLVRHGKIGVVVHVVPHCCYLLQLRVDIANFVGIEGQSEPMPDHVLTVAIVVLKPVKQCLHHVGTVVVDFHSCRMTRMFESFAAAMIVVTARAVFPAVAGL